MDATSTVTIAHSLGNLAFQNIRNINAIILDDNNVYRFNIANQYTDNIAVDGSVISAASGGIVLSRRPSGVFDGVAFAATAETVANRGWVFIEYEA